MQITGATQCKLIPVTGTEQFIILRKLNEKKKKDIICS